MLFTQTYLLNRDKDLKPKYPTDSKVEMLVVWIS